MFQAGFYARTQLLLSNCLTWVPSSKVVVRATGKTGASLEDLSLGVRNLGPIKQLCSQPVQYRSSSLFEFVVFPPYEPNKLSTFLPSKGREEEEKLTVALFPSILSCEG